jgi:WD40 repeat protein
MAGCTLSFRLQFFHQIYSESIQESPTLNLVNDYIRFVITFFEVINTSAPHIYHSALLLSPRTSMVHKLHKAYVRPLARVVRGLPISWDPVVATADCGDYIWEVAWSSCCRFVAASTPKAVEVLDAVTLERLHTFKHPVTGETRWLSFSPDSRSLTLFSHGDYGIITWDLQTGGRIGAIPSAANTPPVKYFSSAYSVDGKVVAVAYRENYTVTVISTYNLVSGTHIYSHRVLEGRIVPSIWTHGEYLRFATVKPGSITVWEVGFTSIHTLTEVESLPAPDDIGSEECLFLPTRSRLAFILNRKAVLVWDARDSKLLLNFASNERPSHFPSPPMVASSLVKHPPTIFISGRSLLLATSFIDTSHPASVSDHSSPQMENRSSRTLVEKFGCGTQQIQSPPSPPFRLNLLTNPPSFWPFRQINH